MPTVSGASFSRLKNRLRSSGPPCLGSPGPRSTPHGYTSGTATPGDVVQYTLTDTLRIRNPACGMNARVESHIYHGCRISVSVFGAPKRCVEDTLADLGVRRISVGGALARVAWGGFLAAAEEISERGTFSHLSRATQFGPLDGRFSRTTGNEIP